MTFGNIRLDALMPAFLITFLMTDLYPHPQWGMGITFQPSLVLKGLLIEHQ